MPDPGAPADLTHGSPAGSSPVSPAGQPGAFRFQRDARSGGTLLVIAVWLCLLFALWALFDAAVWILVLLALPVGPALWEIWRNPEAWLEIDDTACRWHSPRSTADIALTEIDHMALVTRWDFSIRATIHTRPGTHHRIPPEVTPKAPALEAALAARGIAIKTQHFTVL